MEILFHSSVLINQATARNDLIKQGIQAGMQTKGENKSLHALTA